MERYIIVIIYNKCKNSRNSFLALKYLFLSVKIYPIFYLNTEYVFALFASKGMEVMCETTYLTNYPLDPRSTCLLFGKKFLHVGKCHQFCGQF